MSTHRVWWLAPACVGLWLAACGSDDQPPPAAGGGSSPMTPDRGGSSTHRAGDVNAPAGAGGVPSAGAGGEAVEHLPIGQIGGGNFAEPSGGAPANTPPECDPEARWSGAVAVAGVSTAADERLLTMTPDELTLVFSRDSALFVADRATTGGPLASAALVLPSEYDAARGLAIDAAGLALVLVREDGAAFAELTRTSRDAAFGQQPSVSRFAAVNDARVFSGGELSSPVLSEDGRTFFYVEHRAGRSDVWRATGAQLDARTKLDAVTLGGDDGMAKLTLSISADQRALFVFDEALGHVVGLWSTTPAAAFTQPVLLPELESAFTNHDCTRLYGTRSSGTSLDVVLATP